MRKDGRNSYTNGIPKIRGKENSQKKKKETNMMATIGTRGLDLEETKTLEVWHSNMAAAVKPNDNDDDDDDDDKNVY